MSVILLDESTDGLVHEGASMASVIEIWHGPFRYEHLPEVPAKESDRFGDEDGDFSVGLR